MRLSCIKVEGKALDEFQQDLSQIVDLMDELQQVDTNDVPPLTNPCDDIQRLRADEVTVIDQRAEWQKSAPAVEAGLYLVPKVVE